MSKKGRFKDFNWNKFKYDEFITVIGAGGIGSYFMSWLSRIDNFNVLLYDFDSFDIYNSGSQMMLNSAIGKPKASALVDFCKEFSSPEKTIIPINEMYTEESDVTPIMFVLPDNMKVRKIAFDKWKSQDDRLIFIDGRLLGENMTIFVVTKGHESRYEEHLFDDKEVAAEPCTMKSTSHSGAIIGGYIQSWFNNWCANQYMEDDFYDIPFKTEINLANPLHYKIELL